MTCPPPAPVVPPTLPPLPGVPPAPVVPPLPCVARPWPPHAVRPNRSQAPAPMIVVAVLFMLASLRRRYARTVPSSRQPGLGPNLEECGLYPSGAFRNLRPVLLFRLGSRDRGWSASPSSSKAKAGCGSPARPGAAGERGPYSDIQATLAWSLWVTLNGRAPVCMRIVSATG